MTFGTFVMSPCLKQTIEVCGTSVEPYWVFLDKGFRCSGPLLGNYTQLDKG